MATEFDPNALCVICGEPVQSLSYGGPKVCPWCDCGYNRNGTRWSYADFVRLMGRPGHEKVLLGELERPANGD